MRERPQFQPLQAEEVARAFGKHGVDYMFIGKSGAILLGFPGTTQDVDVFPARSAENGGRIVTALREIGFDIAADLEGQIVAGKDFVQIKSGPFDIDLVFAPDGLPDFADARKRRVCNGIFSIANLRDIIASKRAAGRARDKLDLPLLESFRQEYERRNSTPLRSAHEIGEKSSGGDRA